MKRWHIISLILAFALLCSCENDPFVDRDDCPIRFSAGVAVETKALKPNDPTVLLKQGNQVSIFGTRVYNDTPEDVFTNRTLTCDASPNPSTPSNPLSSVWSYTPLEYWKSNGDYYFSAVFPFNNELSIDKNSTSYELKVSYFAGSNTDLMVARNYRDATSSKDPVNLTFKHTTAAVRFLFGKASASDADQYQLTSFQLENIVPSGSLTLYTKITTELTTIPSTDCFWTVPSTYINPLFSWTADTPSDRKTIPHPSNANDPDGYIAMGWYYMVPQTLSSDASVRFTVSYKNGTPFETVLNIHNVGTTWVSNHVYNYFITLNQSGLDLTVQTIPWTEVQVTTDDFNFE